MIDYLLSRFREAGQMLPASITVRDGGGGSGVIASVDEHGIIFVEDDKSASAIPWTSIIVLRLGD